MGGGGGGGGANPFAAGGFPGFGGAGGPGGATFSFSSGGGPGGFQPSDPNDIFSHIFGQMGTGGLFDDMDGGMGGSKGARRGASMGGMPGMNFDMGGGGGGMPGGFGGGFGGMGGMGGMGGRQQQQQSASPGGEAAVEIKDIEKPLAISLEDLYKGVTKKLKLGRRNLNGTTEDKTLAIEVKPGWKKGTKVRFAGSGNEVQPGKSQDIVFVIEEKPHDRFKREDNDLVLEQPLALLDALDPPRAGAPTSKRFINSLDGRRIDVPLPSLKPGCTTIQSGQTTRVAGEGMPLSKTGGKQKGDLVVKWQVTLPERLNDQQKKDIRAALS